MAYGTLKCDNITFTNGDADQTITVSGIVQSISGDITATGTIQGATIVGTSTVSGATVTGDSGQYGNLNSVSGVFTTQISGATITGDAGNYSELTATSGVFTTQISGATVTGDTGSFTSVTGGVATITSGVFALGEEALPSISFSSDPNTGIYSPGEDQVAISTNGSGRLFVDASGNVLVNDSASVTSNVSAYLRIRQVNAAADTSIGIINAQNSDANATVKIKAGQATRNGGEIVFGRENGADWSTTTNADGYIAFSPVLNNTNTEALRITSDGKVGLGTSSPDQLLHISSGGNTRAKIATTSTSSFGQLYLGDDEDKFLIGYGSAHPNQPDDLALRNNTGGIFFATGTSTSAECVRIDSSGNVGVGTTSPGSKLEIAGVDQETLLHLSTGNTAGDSYAQIRGDNEAGLRIRGGGSQEGGTIELGGGQRDTDPGVIKFSTGTTGDATEKARIDSSGRLLVGTSSSSNVGFAHAVQIEGTDGAGASLSIIRNSDDAFGAFIDLAKTRGSSNGSNNLVSDDDQVGILSFRAADGSDKNSACAHIQCQVDGTPGANDMPGRLVFSTTADGASSPTERMRIGNNGRTDYFVTNATYGWYLGHTGSAGTTQYFIACGYSASGINTGTVSFRVSTNGNVQNTNNSYGAISDIKLKENIVDANPQWDDIKALQVRNYNFKEGQTHTQIGLVAQEVELVSPGLVSESPDRDEDGNDLGTVTKSVNYSVLYMKAVKALQEAMERIETLEASNIDLLARVSALESA